MLFLRQHGVRYTWVTTNEYGITVWKYKRNSMLFELLQQFYTEEEKYNSTK